MNMLSMNKLSFIAVSARSLRAKKKTTTPCSFPKGSKKLIRLCWWVQGVRSRGQWHPFLIFCLALSPGINDKELVPFCSAQFPGPQWTPMRCFGFDPAKVEHCRSRKRSIGVRVTGLPVKQALEKSRLSSLQDNSIYSLQRTHLLEPIQEVTQAFP